MIYTCEYCSRTFDSEKEQIYYTSHCDHDTGQMIYRVKCSHCVDNKKPIDTKQDAYDRAMGVL